MGYNRIVNRERTAAWNLPPWDDPPDKIGSPAVPSRGAPQTVDRLGGTIKNTNTAFAAPATDIDAVEIGKFYRKARETLGGAATADTPIEPTEVIPPNETERRGVTPIRLFSGKLSGSRNGRNSRYSNLGRSIDATVCHWCDQKFAPGQMRYPILTDTSMGWQAVSVCMECFKEARPDSTGEGKKYRNGRPLAPRRETKCAGCGEPIFASPDHKPRLQICSFRCYQRIYRKRRRGVGSAVEWKLENRPARCDACKQPIKQHRRDARFCSNRCRQWHYRRRKQGTINLIPEPKREATRTLGEIRADEFFNPQTTRPRSWKS